MTNPISNNNIKVKHLYNMCHYVSMIILSLKFTYCIIVNVCCGKICCTTQYSDDRHPEVRKFTRV